MFLRHWYLYLSPMLVSHALALGSSDAELKALHEKAATLQHEIRGELVSAQADFLDDPDTYSKKMEDIEKKEHQLTQLFDEIERLEAEDATH